MRRFATALSAAEPAPKHERALLPPAVRHAVPYVLAAASVAFAVWSSMFLEEHGFRRPSAIFFFAVASTIWFPGVGPSIVAAVLSSLAFQYYFVEPTGSFAVAPTDVPYYVTFLLFSATLAGFSFVRRRAERELFDSRERLRAEMAERTQQANLLNLTHDTIFVRGLDDVITYWNRGAEELYGWTPEQAIGKISHELLQTEFPIPREEIRAELLRAGRWEGELRKRKANGERVFVSSRWSLRFDEQGRPTGILETGNDITDRKRRDGQIRGLNEQLEKRSAELEASNKELEAFAYSISHDLRAPLRHMIGFAELLRQGATSSLDEKSRHYLGTILDAARRMGQLIDDLLAFSRIGRAEASATTVSLQQLVKEVVEELRPEAAGRSISWSIGALPDVYGDRSMLRVVFVNLIANALKFTRTRPRAEIEIGSFDDPARGLSVFVKDNGVGFDMKYSNKLFRVFQRLHRSEDFEGTGIGLATVQRVVQRHGGTVAAEGAVNGGATFFVFLPPETSR